MLSIAQKEWSDIKTCCKNAPRNNARLISVFQERGLHFLLFILPASSMGSFLLACVAGVPLHKSAWHKTCACVWGRRQLRTESHYQLGEANASKWPLRASAALPFALPTPQEFLPGKPVLSLLPRLAQKVSPCLSPGPGTRPPRARLQVSLQCSTWQTCCPV